jgi:hypothetical protein
MISLRIDRNIACAFYSPLASDRPSRDWSMAISGRLNGRYGINRVKSRNGLLTIDQVAAIGLGGKECKLVILNG